MRWSRATPCCLSSTSLTGWRRRKCPGEKIKATGRMAMSAAEDDFALSLVKRLDCPVILVLNKIDAVRKQELLPLIAHWSAQHTFADVVPISARKKEGLDLLLDKIVAVLPEGQRYFPRDQVTDQPERFLVAELIREKILMLTGEEVPYATAVVIEKFEEPASLKKMKDGRLPLTKIAAAIYCERTGQKAILIGKQGAMLKQIGTAARKEIESLLGTRVFLELFVKVQEEWRSSRGFVEELDWRRQLRTDRREAAARRIVASVVPACRFAGPDRNKMSVRIDDESTPVPPRSASAAAATKDMSHPKCAAIHGVSEAVHAPPICPPIFIIPETMPVYSPAMSAETAQKLLCARYRTPAPHASTSAAVCAVVRPGSQQQQHRRQRQRDPWQQAAALTQAEARA